MSYLFLITAQLSLVKQSKYHFKKNHLFIAYFLAPLKDIVQVLTRTTRLFMVKIPIDKTP